MREAAAEEGQDQQERGREEVFLGRHGFGLGAARRKLGVLIVDPLSCACALCGKGERWMTCWSGVTQTNARRARPAGVGACVCVAETEHKGGQGESKEEVPPS